MPIVNTEERPHSRSGDLCPKCRRAFLKIYRSRRRGGAVLRYLKCEQPFCGFRPADNPWIVPLVEQLGPWPSRTLPPPAERQCACGGYLRLSSRYALGSGKARRRPGVPVLYLVCVRCGQRRREYQKRNRAADGRAA